MTRRPPPRSWTAPSQDLKPASLRVDVAGVRTEGERATADVDVDWDLGENRHWTYRTSWPLRPAEDSAMNDTGWEIDFSPAVVDPRLGPGQRPVLRTTRSTPAPVLDDKGAPLLAPSRTVTVTLDPRAGDVNATAGTLASALGPIDPTITRTSITDGARTTPAGQAYTVAVLREDDYQRVRDRIYDLPGVRFVDDTRLLAPDTGFATQVLTAVRTEVDGQTGGTPGWTVDAVGQNGATVASLAGRPARARHAGHAGHGPAGAAGGRERRPRAGQADRDRRDPPVERGRPRRRPERPGERGGPDRALRSLPAGLHVQDDHRVRRDGPHGITPDTPEDCPGTTVINGRTIPNEDAFALGTVPLLQAFAKSCNTTFSRLALGLTPDALPDAALKLGFGSDYKIPGLTTVTGSIEPATDDLQRASDGFGQGDVLGSPFGMALVAATIAKGAPVTPSLIRDRPTETTKAPGTPDQAVLDKLRPMMRAVVTQGTATAAAGQGEVFGKTGTAEFAGPTGENRAHGWFVGYRGRHGVRRPDRRRRVVRSGRAARVHVPRRRSAVNPPTVGCTTCIRP